MKDKTSDSWQRRERASLVGKGQRGLRLALLRELITHMQEWVCSGGTVSVMAAAAFGNEKVSERPRQVSEVRR